MRIVGFFFKWLIILGALTAFGYFFCGQLWMAVRLGAFLDQVKDLETSNHNLTTYARTCQHAPAASAFSAPVAIQLRFIDATHYNIELRCSKIENQPVKMGEGALPFLIKKTSGSSGLYVDLHGPTIGSITLESLAATKTITLDTSSQYSGAAAIPSSPATSCEGWGYRCCSPDQEKGMGATQASGVTDCASNCFSACKALPYVQSFTTDPFPGQSGTVIMTEPTLTVTFSYSVTDASAPVANVHIDFGDGTSDDSKEAVGAFVHTYSCPGPCTNLAIVSTTDTAGNSSVANDTSRLYIKRE